MATTEQIQDLRLKAGDTEEPFVFATEYLNGRLDAGEAPDAIASDLWRQKAASYAELVDVSESGSTRKLSDLRKNALEMAGYYDNLVQASIIAVSSRPRTRAIVRPEPS